MTIEYINQDEWNKLTEDTCHFMQSNFWAKLKSNTGWSAKHLLIKDAGNIAGIQILVKKEGFARVGYTGRFEPKVKNHLNPSVVLDALKTFSKNENLQMLKIDPNLYLDNDEGKEWLTCLEQDNKIRLSKQLQSRGTAISDLSNFESLLGKFNKRTRYNIRNAKKRGVSIRIEPANKENFEEFWELYVETSIRKGFILRPLSYYLNLIESTKDTKFNAFLTFADHIDDNNPITASFMIIRGKDAWLLYAASSLRKRNLMPNDLLEYSNLEFAANKGVVTYDWWGAPFDKDDENDPMYTVWHFKKRFLSEHKQLVGAWDYYPASVKATLFKNLNLIRNKYLIIRKKLVALKAK